jgi:hypothetical protein
MKVEMARFLPPHVGPYNLLPEIVGYFHYQLHLPIKSPEPQFIPRMPLENTKEGQIKDPENLGCMWCKSYNAQTCFNKKMEHIINKTPTSFANTAKPRKLTRYSKKTDLI